MVKRIVATVVAVAAGIGVSHQHVWAAAGRTPGRFAISAVGSAQYSIPIWTPPGPRGIQPNLALSYDSRAAVGPLGVGWYVNGLGAITRCNKTYAQDTTPAPVALAASDGYCLNGNRLRLTSGTYGTTGSTYQTEIADFSNVTANGTAGNGPQYFTVQGRDGLTYQYGYTDSNGNGANSAVLASGASTVSQWLLSKVSDRAGNNYVINYTTLTGTAVPNTILWTPTSEGAATYAYTVQFNYTTNVPQSSLSKYIWGTAVADGKLLQSIAISYSGTVVRDYFLTYQASPTTGRDELKTVTECADSTETNCLLPTTVSYQAGAAGVASSPTTAVSSSGTGLVAKYDINGDGYPDLVYNPTGNGAWYIAFGSATGYATPVATTITGLALFGRLTGSIQDDILANNGGTWYWYHWNGGGFTSTTTGIAYDTATYGYQLADVNGDGLPDLIDLEVVTVGKTFTARVITRLNTGGGSTVSFGSTNLAYSASGIYGAQLETSDSQWSALRRYDFNGDGIDDIALTLIVGPGPNYSLSTLELLSNSTGTAFTPALVATVSGSAPFPPFFADWNDDGCTDFVSNGNLYISACNGTSLPPIAVGNVIAAMDWDGDGRTDLLVAGANGSPLSVIYSTGTGISSPQTTGVNYNSSCQYVTLDVNADGLDDLGCWSQSGSSPLTYYLHNGAFTPPDLATSFVDGFRNSVTAKYASISQPSTAYNAWNDQVFPYQNWIGPYYVAYLATFSDPSSATGATYYQQYWYAGASMNLQGRGFAGFAAVQSYDSRNGIWSTTDYSRVFPYFGMSSYRVSAQDNLNAKPIVAATTNLTSLTLDGTANNERYFPYVGTATINRYEVGGTENTQLITNVAVNYGTPDAYGNFDSVTKTVTDEDSASPYYGDTWTTTTANTITAQTGSTWCLSLPTQSTVTNSSTAPNGAAITRTVSYTPDYSNCRETGKVVEPSSSTYKVTEAYTFDSFGNLYTDTVTGVGMNARVTTMTWGMTGQFLTTVQNPATQSIALGYDFSRGVQTSQTDPNFTSSNPLQMTWAYDPFARKSQENRPDGTYTKWVYNDCASTGGCLIGSHGLAVAQTVYNSDGTTETDGTTYLDSVDRTLVSNKRMLASGTYDRNEVRYDNLGRVAQQAAPCVWSGIGTACTYWTTNNYDILNRITQTQRPISASNSTLQTTIFGYAGRTSTVKDALGNTTAKITLVTGKPARTVDPKGYYENFSYDAFGSLKSVTDSASNSLFSANYAYGINAFQTSSSDMDLGARSYTIDALGEVTAYSDAKGQSFSQTYDALSRPLVRTDNVSAPDLTTTWTWGTSAGSYNIGRLQTVTAAGSNGTYAESYSFDSLTRPQTKTISVPSDASYTYISTYNAVTGLLDTLSYPTSTAGYSLKLQYGYANGILQQVKDANSSTVFWQNTGMNARGQVTQETLGNGIVTNRAYDAVTGWVASIEAGVNGGAGVQNQAYVFDYLGNVTQRQDNNLGLTENFYYDADYRLDHSVLNGTLNLQMTYDGGNPGPGNITARSDVAGGSTWTYDSVRKHAVTQAGTGGYAFTYDANGNAATRNGYNITWSSYNYPISINGQNKNVTLYYGPNRQYYEQVYSDGSSIEQTIYAGGLLEKVTLGSLVDWRHYIRVNNELVAIMSRQSSGTNVTHYTLSDHQGSLAEITDGSGATTVTEDFNAFGARRNPATWSGMPTCPDLCTIKAITREGYTGHDAIGGVSLGLNHMNGRVEDAITGRFLSPDPQGINFGNTQSFNRYSYVGNNPLSFTDPMGFSQSHFTFCIDACPGPNAGLYAPGFQSGGGGSLDGLQGTDSSGDMPDGFNYGAANDAIASTSAAINSALDSALAASSPALNFTTTTSDGGAAGGTSSGGSAQSQAPNLSMAPSDDGTGAILSEGTAITQTTSSTVSSFDPSVGLGSDPSFMQSNGKGPFSKSPRFTCTVKGCGAPHGGRTGTYCPECDGKSRNPVNGIPPNPFSENDDPEDSNPANQGQYTVPSSTITTTAGAIFLAAFLGWLFSPN